MSAKQALADADQATAMRLSAELHALCRFYEGQFNHPQDYHLLLCTDTWLGEQTADILKDWLIGQGIRMVEVRRQVGLQTNQEVDFLLALSDIVSFCEQEVLKYRENNYYVVFNLTAGFKSVQGFLQKVSDFYADESIYVFESNKSLLRMPRLQIKMDAEDVVEENLTVIRRLAMDLPVAIDEVANIPETLLIILDEDIGLSTWGDLVWKKSKKAIFCKRLYSSPSKLIRYGSDFERSLRNLAPERLCMINEQIDQLADCLEASHCLPSLDLKPLRTDRMLPSTHEIDAWADGGAPRIFGHYEGSVFVLDKFGEGLH